MGDHTNGPSKVKITESNEILTKLIDDADFIAKFKDQEISIQELFKHNP